MIQRLVAGLLMLAVVVCAQRRVDPKDMYYRLLCVAPYVGDGTEENPKRPKYAPKPNTARSQRGIIGYSQISSDDGTVAIVEFIATDAKAFDEILRDPQVRSFVREGRNRAQIESVLQRYKKDFELAKFGAVVR